MAPTAPTLGGRAGAGRGAGGRCWQESARHSGLRALPGQLQDGCSEGGAPWSRSLLTYAGKNASWCGRGGEGRGTLTPLWTSPGHPGPAHLAVSFRQLHGWSRNTGRHSAHNTELEKSMQARGHTSDGGSEEHTTEGHANGEDPCRSKGATPRRAPRKQSVSSSHWGTAHPLQSGGRGPCRHPRERRHGTRAQTHTDALVSDTTRPALGRQVPRGGTEDGTPAPPPAASAAAAEPDGAELLERPVRLLPTRACSWRPGCPRDGRPVLGTALVSALAFTPSTHTHTRTHPSCPPQTTAGGALAALWGRGTVTVVDTARSPVS